MLNFANRLLNLQKSIPPLSSSIRAPAGVILAKSIFTTPSSARFFHNSLRIMAAQKIDGTAIAKYVVFLNLPLTFHRALREQVKEEITEIQKRNPRFKPGLAIVQVGDRPDSTTYVRMKGKAAQEVSPPLAVTNNNRQT